jgi:hypothetical protein
VGTNGKILGVCGTAGSGKGVVAEVLMNHGWQLVKMSGPLKAMLTALFREMGYTSDATQDLIEGSSKEAEAIFGNSPRRLMQTLGTDWGREMIGSSFWVRIAMEKIAALTLRGHNVVIDDVRFQNEIDAICLLGGSCLKVERPDPARNPGEHKSESVALLRPDFIVHNDGSLEEFRDKITRMFT